MLCLFMFWSKILTGVTLLSLMVATIFFWSSSCSSQGIHTKTWTRTCPMLLQTLGKSVFVRVCGWVGRGRAWLGHIRCSWCFWVKERVLRMDQLVTSVAFCVKGKYSPAKLCTMSKDVSYVYVFSLSAFPTCEHTSTFRGFFGRQSCFDWQLLSISFF